MYLKFPAAFDAKIGSSPLGCFPELYLKGASGYQGSLSNMAVIADFDWTSMPLFANYLLCCLAIAKTSDCKAEKSQ